MSYPAFPIAVVIEHLILENRWASEKWEVQGIIPDTGVAPPAGRIIHRSTRATQYLFGGLELALSRSEAENYYLNLTSPSPKVFIMWRLQNEVARPVLATVSYGEGARYLDSGENVDGVPMPPEIIAWLGTYVEDNYRPQPKLPRKRRQGREGAI